MSRINDLVREAKRLDPTLGSALETEVRHLQERRAFGLNFERHTPESVELYGRTVRVGDKVRMLPPRGSSDAVDRQLWKVVGGTKDDDGSLVASLRAVRGEDEATWPLDDLVVVAEHTDRIYPGLVSTERIERGGGQPWHTVINAENLHALKALLYTHRGKVDLIYIDPPYNTGTDDWIYNDKHIAPDDLYRHSKWLAFLERRLRLAWELLTPTGVLLISIDDHEMARLRLLLDGLFTEEKYLATLVWRMDGNIDNQAQVKINHEYVVAFSKAPERFRARPIIDPNVDEGSKLFAAQIRNSVVKNGPKNPVSRIVIPSGFPAGFESGTIPARQDKWPKFTQDIEVAEYRVVHPVEVHSGWANARLLRAFISQDCAAVVDTKGQETTFEMTATGAVENVKLRSASQSHILTVMFNQGTTETASNRLASVGLKFPYPKPVSLLAYLVSIFSQDDSVVLDFFAGSGTTFESIVRLNAETGSKRKAIVVTNNEVSLDQKSRLSKLGIRPGDPAWEATGVYRQVTMPRVRAVVGEARGDGMVFANSVDANVEFFDLTYEAPLEVSANLAFERIAPLLWLRAGARGRRIDSLSDGWDVAEAYGVLERFDALDEFLDALAAQPEAELAFLVTDDDRRFEATCAMLPDGVEPLRLYASYLRNFQIDAARSSR